jgi:hypothetical protein
LPTEGFGCRVSVCTTAALAPRLCLTLRSADKERYVDFGPTLACEKLRVQHGLVVSVETLRQWMSTEGLWRTRKQQRKPAQQPRRRRACLGERVQIDGCDHEWFEDRGPRCTLLVYVDDGTSRLMELLLVRSESTFDYLAVSRQRASRMTRTTHTVRCCRKRTFGESSRGRKNVA